MRTVLLGIFIVMALSQSPAGGENSGEIRYVALGDSFSAGTGAGPQESWPVVMTEFLQQEGVSIRLVANLARSGWTTQDVIEQQIPVFKTLRPTLASILIGANDLTRGVSLKDYRRQLGILLDRMIQVLPDKRNIIVVTIPDYAATPVGAQLMAAGAGGKGIAAFNQIIKREAAKRKLAVVDIYESSGRMALDPSLVSADGLHPSAKEYAIWAEYISEFACKLIRNPQRR